MNLTLRLSMVTHTPTTHWLSLPWVETCEWAAQVVLIQAADLEAAKRG